MRITFLTHFPGRGGSTEFLRQLRTFFDARGHDTSVICGEDSEHPLIDRYAVVTKFPRNDWRERREAYLKVVKDTSPDVVYVISGIEEFDIIRFLNVPRAHHIFSIEQHAWIDIPRLIHQTAHFTELFTANTQDVLDEVETMAPASKAATVVAPYRIDSAWFQSHSPAAAELVRVCFCGRIERYQKRAHWLARIIVESRRRHLPIEWHIIGDGPEAQSLRANADGADAHFHGWLAPEQVRSIYGKADLFFMCSRWEGLPVAMVEAMAGGLAALVPRMNGGSSHLLKDGKGGWTYSPRSWRDAVHALEAVCAEQKKLDQKKEQALKIAARYFVPEVADEQLLGLENALRRLTFNGHVENVDSATLRRISLWTFLTQRIPLLISRTA